MTRKEMATALAQAIISNNGHFTAPDTFRNNLYGLSRDAVGTVQVIMNVLREGGQPRSSNDFVDSKIDWPKVFAAFNITELDEISFDD